MKTKNLLLTLLFISLVFSCQREIEMKTNPKNLESDVYKRILAAGFKKESIVDYKDYYLVEGDIVFRKIGNNNVPVQKQAWTGNAVNLLNIKIFLNSSYFSTLNQNGELTRALNNAVNAYNSLNTSLHFEVTDSPGDANIRIDPACGYDPYCGEADFPDGSGSPGFQINLCEYVINELSATSESQLTFLLVHEIGHTIGLRHTNWETYSEYNPPATHIDGTAYTDDYSVMNYGTCGWAWDQYSFTPNDILAIETLYPGPSLSFSQNYFNPSASAWSSGLTITANCDWKLESDQPWLTFNGQSGSQNDDFTIYATENSLQSSRTAHLTASYGDNQVSTVVITQAGVPSQSQLSATPVHFYCECGSEEATFSISSNTNWVVTQNTSYSDVSFNPNPSMGNQTLHVSFNPIPGGSRRHISIKIQTTDGLLTTYVHVWQGLY